MFSRLCVFSLSFLLVLGCAQTVTQGEMARAVEGYIVDINKLSVVDCLLPGQIRKLGAATTYLSQRRPVRTTEADCEVRGGEYVAYDRANYVSALNVWLAKAEEGDAKAQLYVGQIYEKGLGRPADFGQAAAWYRKAAEQGEAQAQISLGALYERGLGVQRDPQVALDWFAKGSGLTIAGLPYDPTLPAPVPQNPSLGSSSTRAPEQAEMAASSVEPSAVDSPSREDGALRQQLDEAQQQLILQQEQLLKAQSELAALRAQGHAPAALHAKEQVLADRENEIERLQHELDAARRKAQSPASEAGEMARIREALAQSEMRYASKQHELQRLREELQTLTQQGPSAPATGSKSLTVADSESMAALKREIQKKDQLLRAQQGRIRDALAQLKKAQQKGPVSKDTKDRGLNEATAAVGQLEIQLEALSEAFNNDSAELSAWLTSKAQTDPALRDRIDQRKKVLQQTSLEIKSVRAKLVNASAHLTTLKAQAQSSPGGGPRIDIIEPELLATRGGRSIRLGPDGVLKGRVYPAQLHLLEFNHQPIAVDAGGLFSFAVNPKTTASIEIKAVDLKGGQSLLNLALLDNSRESTPAGAAPMAGQNPPISGDGVPFGRFYALIIGNNQYQKYPALTTPINDARSVDSVLRERYGFMTRVISNANRHDIMTALNEFQGKMTENDSFIIYYAGHGEIDAKTQQAYWLPVDAEVGNPANWIASKAITDLLSIMPARHIMVISDSCYSGAMSSAAVAKLPPQLDPEKREKWLKAMAARKSRTLLTSGDVRPVLDSGGDGHSVFAQSLLKVLRSYRGVLEDYEIFRAVSGDVAAASARLGFKQSPSYAPLQYAGHEGSPFLLKPKG